MTSQANLQAVRPQGSIMPTDLGSTGQRIHLSGEMHTGTFSIIEFTATSETKPDEAFSEMDDRFFCLLEGEWDVRIGDDHFRVKSGGSFHAPPGVTCDYNLISPLGRAVVLLTRPMACTQS